MKAQLFDARPRATRSRVVHTNSGFFAFTAVGFFSILNAGFGLLYQVSRDVICYSELAVLVIGSFLFWVSLSGVIRRFVINVLSRNLAAAQRIGILFSFSAAVLALNILIAQLSVYIIIGHLFKIQTPSDNLLVATLTNNIAGNCLCLISLIAIAIYDHRNVIFDRTLKADRQKERVEDSTFIMISSGNAQVKVNYRDIINIESEQNCITLITASGKFVRYQSLKSFLEGCPYPHFRRIHRSHAVNTEFVSHVRTNDNGDGHVFLKDGTSLKLSRTFKSALMTA